MAFIVVVKLGEKISDLLHNGRTIISSMESNKSLFKNPQPALKTASTKLDAVEAAQTAVDTGGGTTQKRDDEEKEARKLFRQLAAYVQTLVDADEKNAESIVAKAGMFLKTVGTHQKPDFALYPHGSGAVHAVARAHAQHEAHVFELSLDAEKTYSVRKIALEAHVVFDGLPSGTRVFIRHAYITRTGQTEWSAAESIIVP